METDNFVQVTRRRRRRRGKNSSSGNAVTPNAILEQDCECKIDHELRKLKKEVIEIRDTPFARFVFSRLSESLAVLDSNGISEIVCYGLGKFSQSRSSRCQLALLMCLVERYKPDRVHVYDPMFCPGEVQILRILGLEVPEINEEGKRVVQRNRTTLVYMPHCSRLLTNNFLYTNWGDGLSDCILFVNSFSQTIDSCLHEATDIVACLFCTSSYIRRIQPYVTEIRLENSFKYKEVFNDLNIHIFTKQKLHKVPKDFWSSRKEPQYTKFRELITGKQRQITLDTLIQ